MHDECANILGLFVSKFWIPILTPQLRMFFVFQPIESSVLNKLRNESGEKNEFQYLSSCFYR